MLNSDDGALRIPGATSRHEPADADWSRLAELLTTYYAGGLFTILQVDRARGLVRRAYTSEPVAYPTGGTKQLMGTQWAKQVIHEGRCFIASTLVEMEGAFADRRHRSRQPRPSSGATGRRAPGTRRIATRRVISRAARSGRHWPRLRPDGPARGPSGQGDRPRPHPSRRCGPQRHPASI